MSTVTSKERTLLLVTVVVVLYGAAALSFKKQSANWKAAARIYATTQKKVQEERALIGAKDEWFAKYEHMRELMPVFPYDKDVDTHWLNIMDSTATRHGFTIARRQTSKEVEVGDVYELPIDCKDWEGSLESLVKFLYDLNKEGAMLDVRQLFVRPSNKPGYLKGTFTLYCAYMRGDEQKTPAVEQKTEAGGTDSGAGGIESADEGGVTPGVMESELDVPEPAPLPPPVSEAVVTNPVAGPTAAPEMKVR